MIYATHLSNLANAQMDEHELERLRNRAFWAALFARFSRRPAKLLNLQEVASKHRVENSTHTGLHVVPIAQIKGSEGRCDDFDAQFRPRKLHNRERWTNIAQARRNDVSLPAVDLIQIGDTYFVRDGHHRISVARAQGQQEIDANVTVWTCPSFGDNHTVAARQSTWGTHWQSPVRQVRTALSRSLQTAGAYLIALGARVQVDGSQEAATAS